jgi:hypothetical protein
MSSVQRFCIRVLGAIALLASCLAGVGAQQAETPELYGYGVNAKNEPTYFRVRVPSATVTDIGPHGFPFPLGTAYDSLHDRYYWIELDVRGVGTLWVSQGLRGRPKALGSSGQFPGASVMLAYDPINGLLYAFAADPEDAANVFSSMDPATGQGTTIGEYAGPPAQVSCDVYSGYVYVSAAGEWLSVYELPQGFGPYDPWWNNVPPTASCTPFFADLHRGLLWTLDAGDPAQGRAARLLAYASGSTGYAGRLTYEVPLTVIDGVDPSRIEGLFGAPSETGDLYGYGTDEKGKFTYFRFNLVEAEATDIGADAFPFPHDAAYDPVHDVRYSLGSAEGSPDSSDTLYVTYGRSGRTVAVGALSEPITGPSAPVLAYQASTGWSYATSLNLYGPQSLFTIDPAGLAVTSLGPESAYAVACLLWNPVTADLYGLTTVPDSDTVSLVKLGTETGQAGTFIMNLEYGWTFGGGVFGASGRYLYVVGYYALWADFGDPAHLFVYDLEAPLEHTFSTPVMRAPLPPLTSGQAGTPAIGTLFFAPPP